VGLGRAVRPDYSHQARKSPVRRFLDRGVARLAGADADHLINCADENLAVADASRARRFLDGVEHGFDHVILDNELELELGKKVDDVLGAAIEFGVPLLAPITFDFGYGHALQTKLLESFLHVVQLERFDDRFDLLHVASPAPHVDNGASKRLTARAAAHVAVQCSGRPDLIATIVAIPHGAAFWHDDDAMTNLNHVFTCAGHAKADAAAEKRGVAFEVLMRNAGVVVAEAIMARWIPRRTVVLCGPGDNGGDGYVTAARLARAGWPVRVAALGEPRTGGAAERAAKAWTGATSALHGESLGDAELVIDALFGAGLTRALSGDAAAVAEACAQRVRSAQPALGAPGKTKQRRLRVVAIDLPSGVSGDLGRALGPAFDADMTVTFGRWKPAHLLEPARSLCGELAQIGRAHV